MPDTGIALYCQLFPASTEKQQRCLSLLRKAAREYYPLPSSHCTTWSYFTPLKPNDPPLIAGLEIYTRKSALQNQLDDPVYFQSYHHTVEEENLYERPEDLQACYLAAGFVTRGDDGRGREGEGVVVSITRMESREVGEVVEILREFAKWVEAEEAGVLTYAAFTRSKVREEVVLFVRYEDRGWLMRHGEAPEHVAVVKKLRKLLENNIGKSTTVWKEVPDSFVSHEAGNAQAKL